MLLKKIAVHNFRNYERFETAFSPGVNLIMGKNGAGKTTLLEALFVLSTSASPRSTSNAELIRKGKDYYFVNTKMESKYEKFTASAAYSMKKGFGVKINGNKVNRKRLLKLFPVIMFSPEDIEILKGSPSGLRKIFNINIAQTNDFYVDLLIKYRKLLKSRNELLKENSSGPGVKNLKTWTSLLLKYGEKIREIRKSYINNLNEIIKVRLKELNMKSTVTVKYSCSLYRGKKSIETDMNRGYTCWGPHRDSFDFIFNGKSVSSYASRGETRAVAFVYRMATISMVRDKTGRNPLVLLDDLFSELDKEKREIISEGLKNMQVLVTHTHEPSELKDNLSKVIRV